MHLFRPRKRSYVLRKALTIAASLLVALPVHARALMPQQPSVEVNLDVLQTLSTSAAPFPGSAPVDSVSTAPLSPAAAYTPDTANVDRKVPEENPYSARITPEQRAAQRAVAEAKPKGDLPFYRGESPAMRFNFGDEEQPAVKQKPVAVAKAEKPAAPVPAKPKPAPEPKPVVKDTPAPLPVAAPEKPAPLPVAEETKPEASPSELPDFPEMELPKVTDVAPDTSPLPVVKTEPKEAVPPPLPAVIDEKEKPPELPAAPVAETVPKPLPDLLPEPETLKDAAPAIPQAAEEIALPEPPPTEPAPPEVLVQKQGGKVPDLPLLPDTSDESDAKPLPPSLSQRVAQLFARKAEPQEGVVSDTTKTINPLDEIPELPKPEKAKKEVAKEEPEEQAPLPPVPLPTLSLPKADDALPPALPEADEAKKVEDPAIAAPPSLELPKDEKIAAGTTSDEAPDLAPPALPSIDSITGDDETKSSVEIADAKDQIFATDSQSDPIPPAIEPAVSEEKKEASDVLAIEPAPEKKKFEVASLEKPKAEPKPLAAQDDATVSIAFMKDKQDLTEAEKNKLNALVQEILENDSDVRVVAYASGNAEQASMARRVSLSRALQIRAFLIDKGVDQLKVNVQALGNKGEGENLDRADIFVR